MNHCGPPGLKNTDASRVSSIEHRHHYYFSGLLSEIPKSHLHELQHLRA